MRWILEAGEKLTAKLCYSARDITTNFRDDALDGRFPGRPIFPWDQDLASMARPTNAPGHHQR